VELALDESDDGVLRTDWRPLAQVMSDANLTIDERASIFHVSLAQALVQQACAVRRQYSVDVVGLCGGVFQNRRLTEACEQRLRTEGFDVLSGGCLPINDAGISFGQVVEYAARRDPEIRAG
jgi:hydrogenase maturation protein HypF